METQKCLDGVNLASCPAVLINLDPASTHNVFSAFCHLNINAAGGLSRCQHAPRHLQLQTKRENPDWEPNPILQVLADQMHAETGQEVLRVMSLLNEKEELLVAAQTKAAACEVRFLVKPVMPGMYAKRDSPKSGL